MKISQISNYLNSSDDKQIKSALKGLKADGNSSLIKPLADLLLRDQENQKYVPEIIEILSSLKDTQAPEAMIEIVRDEKYLSIRQSLLSTIWNTALDYSPYLADFVLIACEGTLLEAVDCLTIIENIHSEIQESQILESQWHLKEYLEDTAPKDQQKAQIISEIALFLKESDQQIEG